MIKTVIKFVFFTAIFAFSLVSAEAQQVEIYIPEKSVSNHETDETDNLLAKCLATGLKEYCSGISLSKDGETLESSGVSDIVLETFIIDLNDKEDGKKPKVTVQSDTTPKDTGDKKTDVKPVKSAGIEIEFDFNSYKLREDQVKKMSVLAVALADALNEGAHFAIIGHTDGKGSDAYNCKLSAKRASTISGALLIGGATAQLYPIGVGETLLKDRVNPESGKNRRVSFLRLNENANVTLNAFHSLCN